MTDLKEKLELIGMSLSFFIPELVLTAGILLVVCIGLIKGEKDTILTVASILFFALSFFSSCPQLVGICQPDQTLWWHGSEVMISPLT